VQAASVGALLSPAGLSRGAGTSQTISSPLVSPALRAQFAAASPAMEELHTMRSRLFWDEVRDVRLLSASAGSSGTAGFQPAHDPALGTVAGRIPVVPGASLVWRLSCPPTAGAKVVAAIRERRPDVKAQYDWSGGLVWLSLASGDPATDDAAHTTVRSALASSGGHATLVRAPAPVRTRAAVFQPQPPALLALSRRVKESFDPKGIFNAGLLSGGSR